MRVAKVLTTHIGVRVVLLTCLLAGNSISAGEGWDAGVSLQSARTGPGVTLGADGLVYAIGGVDYGIGDKHATNTAERFDEATGSWEYIAPMGVTRHRYDPAAGHWVLLGSRLNTARTGHGIAITGNDCIYVFGGTAEYSPGSDLASVEKYDPATGVWTLVASMHEARGTPGYAVDGQGRIYAIGGGRIGGPVALSTVERYDPESDTWQYVAPIPEPLGLGNPATFVLNGEIYVVGGWQGGSYTDKCYIYSPSTGSWRRGPKMYEGLGLARGVVGASGKAYVIGGEGPNIWAKNRVAVLSVTANVLPVPYFHQGQTHWCFLNCLAMCAKYYGKNVHPLDVARYFNKGRDEAGGSVLEYRKLRVFLGLYDLGPDYLQEYPFPTFARYKDAIDDGEPVILLSLNHAVVVVGYEDGDTDESKALYIHDPSGAFAHKKWGATHADSYMYFKVTFDKFKETFKWHFQHTYQIKGVDPSPPEGVLYIRDKAITRGDEFQYHLSNKHTYLCEWYTESAELSKDLSGPLELKAWVANQGSGVGEQGNPVGENRQYRVEVVIKGDDLTVWPEDIDGDSWVIISPGDAREYTVSVDSDTWQNWEDGSYEVYFNLWEQKPDGDHSRRDEIGPLPLMVCSAHEHRTDIRLFSDVTLIDLNDNFWLWDPKGDVLGHFRGHIRQYGDAWDWSFYMDARAVAGGQPYKDTGRSRLEFKVQVEGGGKVLFSFDECEWISTDTDDDGFYGDLSGLGGRAAFVELGFMYLSPVPPEVHFKVKARIVQTLLDVSYWKLSEEIDGGTVEAPPLPGASIVVTLESHSELHVYDPQGRHTGIDYTTNTVEESIPGSNFMILDAVGNEVPYDGTTPGEGLRQVITLPDILIGSYKIKLVGTSDGPFRLTVEGVQDGRVVSSNTYKGNIVPHQLMMTNVEVSSVEGALTIAYEDLEIEPATVSTDCATNVGEGTATLCGRIINDGGEPCQYRFWYWTQGGGPCIATAWSSDTKTSGESFSQDITGLTPGSRYYFWAQVKNLMGESDWSAPKSFVTLQGLLELVAPNGGQTLLAGSTCEISWKADPTVGDVCIEYSTGPGDSWNIIDCVPSTELYGGYRGGAYPWVVPPVSSCECLVQVSDASEPTTLDLSDATFCIVTQVVPDVVGIPQAGAESAIISAGFVVGTITHNYSDTVPAGAVISQSPAGGTPAVSGSSVNLVISAGSYAAAPPTVIGRFPTDVGASSAMLKGQISDDGGGGCEYRFHYWKPGSLVYNATPWYGFKVAPEVFSVEVTGLTPGCKYYFWAQAKNSAGEGPWSAAVPFVTPGLQME